MTTFEGDGLQPNITAEYFPSAKQQFKISVQWIGIEANEDAFYLIPDAREAHSNRNPMTSDSFAISDIVFQARYRWKLPVFISST